MLVLEQTHFEAEPEEEVELKVVEAQSTFKPFSAHFDLLQFLDHYSLVGSSKVMEQLEDFLLETEASVISNLVEEYCDEKESVLGSLLVEDD